MTHLARLCRLAAFVVPVLVVVGCERAGANDSDDGPMLSTAADTIAFGRNLIVHHGCGDCHGGGDNPAAPMWLVGFRAGTEDTLFRPFKVPTPAGRILDAATKPDAGRRNRARPLQRAADLQRPALWLAPRRNAGCRHHGDDARTGQLPGDAQVPRTADAVAGLPPHVGSRTEGDRGVPEARARSRR